MIIDDRYNQGDDIADYVIDVLKRTPMLNYESRQEAACDEADWEGSSLRMMTI